jgi:uncharacterized membrane protein
MGILETFNFHPPLSSAPVVLFCLTALAECLRLVRPTAHFDFLVRFCLCAAVVATGLAFLSGYQGNEFANATFTVDDRFIAAHHWWGRSLLFLSLFCLALEIVAVRAIYAQSIFMWLYRCVLLCCVGAGLYTGYLGGELVFEHGAAVRRSIEN